MAEFQVNIFGTSNDDLDGSNGNGFIREFVLNIISVTSDITVTDFDMFIEYYAFPWDLIPSGGRATAINTGGVSGRITNVRPQIIHLDNMSPVTFPSLENDCVLNPSGGGSCPNPSDIRIFSMAHGVPVDASPSGYDSNETDMEDVTPQLAILPVEIIIVADGCRYSSVGGSTINIYKDYFSATPLFGGALLNPDNKVIGQDEIIIVN